MFDKILKRKKIDIKPYLKYYIKCGSVTFDDINLNNYKNCIICTKRVSKELPIIEITKGKNKGKLYIEFDKIIPIKQNSNFSFELVKEYWGAMPDNDGIIESGIDEDSLVHIYFNTMYRPPIGIINHLLKKYKDEIIWFSKKNSYDDNEKELLFCFENKKVVTLIQKEKSEEEKQDIKDEHFSLQFFIPLHAVYYGEYVRCYSKNSKSEKFICSCNKEAIKNKLLMFEDYLSHDYCLNDRKETLLNFLGLPEYFEEKIKNAPDEEKYVNYLDLLKFEDDLCPICNKVKVPDLDLYFNNGTSKFKQRYKGEIERLYSINGIVNPIHIYRGNYYLETLLSEKNKKILCMNNDELFKELYSYELNIDLKKELEKYNKLSDDEKKLIKCSLSYDKNNDSFNCYNFAKQKNISIELVDAIMDIYDKKMKSIRKDILSQIHDFDKKAMDYKTLIKPQYGIHIILKRNEKILHIALWTDVIEITEIEGKKEKISKHESNIDIFSTILEILSSYRINMQADDRTYDEWIICNGKKQDITKDDGVWGYGSPTAINHAMIYLKAHVDKDKSTKNIDNILNQWLP